MREPPAYDEVRIEGTGRRVREDQTIRFDFERPVLAAEEKLVIGYLTMEQHGMFEDLSMEQQEQIASTLQR
jgi:hypothetical protein